MHGTVVVEDGQIATLDIGKVVEEHNMWSRQLTEAV